MTALSEADWLNNHNHDNVGARQSGDKIRAHRLVHWKPAALIAAEADSRGSAFLHKSHKRYVHRCPIRANHAAELHNADQAASGRETWL